MIEGREDPFDGRRPLIGMIHLPSLPGAPNYGGQPVTTIAALAAQDARVLQDGGIDGVLIQNSNDHPPVPRVPAATIAAYAVAATEVARVATIPLGINVLKSDAAATIGIAAAVGARFVRLKGYVGAEVGAEGLVQGCAAEAIRLRRELSAEDKLEIWADALQPTSRSLSAIPAVQAARWCVEFGHADRVVITGDSLEESLEVIGDARGHVSVPLILGGGVEPTTARRAIEASDGLIVGRYLRAGGLAGPVERHRVDAFLDAAGRRPGAASGAMS